MADPNLDSGGLGQCRLGDLADAQAEAVSYRDAAPESAARTSRPPTARPGAISHARRGEQSGRAGITVASLPDRPSGMSLRLACYELGWRPVMR
jgi:hypothetical protein